ncbi:MAG: hypothetical protein Q4C65_02605 [Eubacteriales bacterium]|nr:hypothetical protein [Eubacteriales bacterium]
MKSFVKGTFLFAGGAAVGFVIGGLTVIRAAVKSEIFRAAAKDFVKKSIISGVEDFLYGEESCRKRKAP